MPLARWTREAEDKKKEAVFQEVAEECMGLFPDITLLDELQRTYRAIKDFCSVEDLDYILKETDEYYSDRRTHLNYRKSFLDNGHTYNNARRNNMQQKRRVLK
jgi:hypothetical protein